MNHYPEAWGRVSGIKSSSLLTLADKSLKPRGDVYGLYDRSLLQQSSPKTHTQSPAVTGTSVLGVKFKDGVVIAADNLGMRCINPNLPVPISSPCPSS